MKVLVKFDLKFEISDVKYLVGFGVRLFDLPGKNKNVGANFGEKFGRKFGNFVSNSASFFRKFVQQKGGVNNILHR